MLVLQPVDVGPLLFQVVLLGVAWAAIMPYLIAGGASAASATASAIQANKDRQAAENSAAANRQLTEGQFARDLAFRESQQNPFRQQRSQVTTLAGLDALEQVGTRGNVNLSGVPYAHPGLVGNMPRLTPETLMALYAARQSVMAGRTAPDYSEDANRGTSAVLDVYGVGSGRLNPGTDQAFAQGAPSRRSEGLSRRLRENNNPTYLDPYLPNGSTGARRRNPAV